jgi:hypothetical protein
MSQIPTDRLEEIARRVTVYETAMLINSEIRPCSDYEAHLMALEVEALQRVLIEWQRRFGEQQLEKYPWDGLNARTDELLEEK